MKTCNRPYDEHVIGLLFDTLLIRENEHLEMGLLGGNHCFTRGVFVLNVLTKLTYEYSPAY